MILTDLPPNMETVTLILANREADQFKLFQKHYAIFTEMLAKDVFDIGYGKVTLNFAHNELQNIVKEQIVWKRGA